MKVCSFLPAVTQMIYDMGLQDELYGVTFECPEIALKEQPKVVRCILEDKEYSSTEIDKIFSASKAEGRSLYYVDEKILQDVAPDLIFTQDVCEVCQIDTACTSAAIENLSKRPGLVSISPESLHDVFEAAVTIGRAMGHETAALKYLADQQLIINQVIDRQRADKLLPKRVALLEWIEPIYNCGHWIPHQIAYAGGIDMLANPSGDSIVMNWEKIRKYDPEVLVLAPCGFSVERSLQEIHMMTQRDGWNQLTAVKNNAVYVADFDLFTQPSVSTLVKGIQLLAALFHPEQFDVPANLKHKVAKLTQQGVQAG